jgi:hypothetical protein
MDVSFIPAAERRLPVRAVGGSTVSGSKGNLLWAWRTIPGFAGEVIAKMDARRTGAVVDGAGCTPALGTARRLVVVLSPHHSRALLEERLSTLNYPTIKVRNVSWKAHWLCWVVDHAAECSSTAPEAVALMQRFLTSDVSHLCGKRGCYTAFHTTLEPSATNISRATCHNQRLSALCPHDPPCVRSPIPSPVPFEME